MPVAQRIEISAVDVLRVIVDKIDELEKQGKQVNYQQVFGKSKEEIEKLLHSGKEEEIKKVEVNLTALEELGIEINPRVKSVFEGKEITVGDLQGLVQEFAKRVSGPRRKVMNAVDVLFKFRELKTKRRAWGVSVGGVAVWGKSAVPIRQEVPKISARYVEEVKKRDIHYHYGVEAALYERGKVKFYPIGGVENISYVPYAGLIYEAPGGLEIPISGRGMQPMYQAYSLAFQQRLSKAMSYGKRHGFLPGVAKFLGFADAWEKARKEKNILKKVSAFFGTLIGSWFNTLVNVVGRFSLALNGIISLFMTKHKVKNKLTEKEEVKEILYIQSLVAEGDYETAYKVVKGYYENVEKQMEAGKLSYSAEFAGYILYMHDFLQLTVYKPGVSPLFTRWFMYGSAKKWVVDRENKYYEKLQALKGSEKPEDRKIAIALATYFVLKTAHVGGVGQFVAPSYLIHAEKRLEYEKTAFDVLSKAGQSAVRFYIDILSGGVLSSKDYHAYAKWELVVNPQYVEISTAGLPLAVKDTVARFNARIWIVSALLGSVRNFPQNRYVRRNVEKLVLDRLVELLSRNPPRDKAVLVSTLNEIRVLSELLQNPKNDDLRALASGVQKLFAGESIDDSPVWIRKLLGKWKEPIRNYEQSEAELMVGGLKINTKEFAEERTLGLNPSRLVHRGSLGIVQPNPVIIDVNGAFYGIKPLHERGNYVVVLKGENEQELLHQLLTFDYDVRKNIVGYGWVEEGKIKLRVKKDANLPDLSQISESQIKVHPIYDSASYAWSELYRGTLLSEKDLSKQVNIAVGKATEGIEKCFAGGNLCYAVYYKGKKGELSKEQLNNLLDSFVKGLAPNTGNVPKGSEVYFVFKYYNPNIQWKGKKGVWRVWISKPFTSEGWKTWE